MQEGGGTHMNGTQQRRRWCGSKQPGLQSVTLWYFLLLVFDAAAAAQKPEMSVKLGWR